MPLDFRYSLPPKPAIDFWEDERTKACLRCGVSFTTTSRIQKRCKACAKIVAHQQRVDAARRAKQRKRQVDVGKR